MGTYVCKKASVLYKDYSLRIASSKATDRDDKGIELYNIWREDFLGRGFAYGRVRTIDSFETCRKKGISISMVRNYKIIGWLRSWQEHPD